jgi:hypothetical protein
MEVTNKEKDYSNYKIVSSRIENGMLITELEEKEDLKLDVSGVDLEVRYKGNLMYYINSDGLCFFSGSAGCIDLYSKWVEDGMPIDDSIVEWRGGRYQITKDYTLKRIDIGRGNIYNFRDTSTFHECQDPNIKRFPHNNRPIIF